MTRHDEINDVMMRFARERGPTKTFDLSEVARSIDATHWQELMDEVRVVARELIASNVLIAKQKGQPVDFDGAKGPVRLGLRHE